MFFVRKICSTWNFSPGPGRRLTSLGFGLVWFYVGLGPLSLLPCHGVCAKAEACGARRRRCRWERETPEVTVGPLLALEPDLESSGSRREEVGAGPTRRLRASSEGEGEGRDVGGRLPVVCSCRRFPDVDGSGREEAPGLRAPRAGTCSGDRLEGGAVPGTRPLQAVTARRGELLLRSF